MNSTRPSHPKVHDSRPDNASLARLHASLVLYILVSYAGVSTPSEPKDSNSRPLCMIANSYFARLRMQHICKREGERRRCKFRLLGRDRPVQKKTGFRLQKARFIAEWRRASLVCLHASAFYFATLVLPRPASKQAASHKTKTDFAIGAIFPRSRPGRMRSAWMKSCFFRALFL